MGFKLTTLLLLLVIPIQAGAINLIEEISVPQGETIELIIPKFDFTDITAEFEGKPITFYDYYEDIDELSPITRAEFLRQIYCYFYQSSYEAEKFATTQLFPDVPEQSEFFDTIQWAAGKEIVHGYEDGLFHPFDKITRGQAAKIIMNTYDLPQTLEEIPKFPDLPDTYSLKDYMYIAVGAEIFKGYPDGFMRPNRSINFLEADLIIQRSGVDIIVPLKEIKRYSFRAFLGIHRLSSTGNKQLTFNLTDLQGNQIEHTATITVTKQNFKSEWFTLAQEKNKLLGSDYQDNTWELINAAKSSPSSEELWKEEFIVPTEGEITLTFGDKLYINGSYSGSHFGIDYANIEGTPIHASNDGIVTLAAETPTYGNTVVIDHGQNIFTMYLHLSELKTLAGETVNKGDLIGLMGSTGVATGSHLHFTHFVGDIIVNSQPWFDGQY
ncbi:peptidoglycan DD-metalloendopeptidase family protein [Pseudomonadota bacterium]